MAVGHKNFIQSAQVRKSGLESVLRTIVGEVGRQEEMKRYAYFLDVFDWFREDGNSSPNIPGPEQFKERAKGVAKFLTECYGGAYSIHLEDMDMLSPFEQEIVQELIRTKESHQVRIHFDRQEVAASDQAMSGAEKVAWILEMQESYLVPDLLDLLREQDNQEDRLFFLGEYLTMLVKHGRFACALPYARELLAEIDTSMEEIKPYLHRAIFALAIDESHKEEAKQLIDRLTEQPELVVTCAFLTTKFYSSVDDRLMAAFETHLSKQDEGSRLPYLYNIKALLQFKRGEYSSALDSLTQAIGLAQVHGTPGETGIFYHNAGDVYKRMGDQDRAIEHYQQGAALDPLSSKYRLSLARLHVKREEWESAGEYYEQALAARPHSLIVANEVIDYFEKRGQHDKCNEIAEKLSHYYLDRVLA